MDRRITSPTRRIMDEIVCGRLYMGDSNALSTEEKSYRAEVFELLNKMFVEAGYCAAYQYMLYGYAFLGCSNNACKLRHERFPLQNL